MLIWALVCIQSNDSFCTKKFRCCGQDPEVSQASTLLLCAHGLEAVSFTLWPWVWGLQKYLLTKFSQASILTESNRNSNVVGCRGWVGSTCSPFLLLPYSLYSVLSQKLNPSERIKRCDECCYWAGSRSSQGLSHMPTSSLSSTHTWHHGKLSSLALS